MIRFLAIDVIGLRIVDVKRWRFQSDRQSQIVFSRTGDTIEQRAAKKRGSAPGEEPVIEVLDDANSVDKPFVQVADFFAGLAVFARQHARAVYDTLRLPDEKQREQWKQKRGIFKTNRERERYTVVKLLLEKARAAGIPLRFDRERGFEAPVASPLRFWHYTVQGSYDKAPGSKDFSASPAPGSYTYLCSVKGCDLEIELEYYSARPLCPEHFRQSREVADERSETQAAKAAHKEGTHYCEVCLLMRTPTDEERYIAESIGKNPKCPKCKRQLVPMGGDGGTGYTIDSQVEQFEGRRDRFDR